MKRFLGGLVFMLVFALAITTVSTSISATSANKGVTPQSVLESYLQAVKEQNVDKIMSYVIDERDLTVADYKEMMSYEKLNNYEIVKSETLSDGTHYYVVNSSYEGGLVKDVPLEVKKVGTEWKVNINTDTLSSDDNKTLQQGSDQYYENVFSIIENQDPVMKTMDVLMWWDFSKRQGGKTFYSNSKFSVPGIHKYVILGIDTQLSTKPNNTGINYAVVRKGVLGDTVWGTKYVKGHFMGENKRIKLNGNTMTFKGANLRFIPNAPGVYAGIGGLDW
ncbi:hypothetical protein [Bacillus sp. G1(2015b)]|uniref:hypothetical protein n=1 Tax=Bacillus sp. G1(2015b) TaxID=1706732 RepID=UPI0007386D54|nr:hypothetical protein [Bacillus sp. G1(2015b)]KUF26846.1 hypothetical protein AMR95_01735 [Bacillus sp. G1(2015b)]